MQHGDYSLQCDLKRDFVQDAFERIYRAPFPAIGPCVKSPKERNYRNKSSLPLARKGKQTEIGYYAKGSHVLVPVQRCPVLARPMEEYPGKISTLLSELGLPPYDEKKETGLLRHLILRSNGEEDEILLSLVVARNLSKEERGLVEKKLVPALTSENPKIRTITLNHNYKRGNVILGGKTETIFGDGLIEERLGFFKFQYDTTAFFQINSPQALKLYETAASMAESVGGKKILELFSGIGSLTCFLADKSSSVTAVEEWGPSVALMRKNVEANGFKNKVQIISGRVENNMDALRESYDVVVIDPPRKGCSPEVIRLILDCRPEALVYVSCNPATLARDGALLLEGGYKPAQIQCFDMFPHTVHVETVALMSRKND